MLTVNWTTPHITANLIHRSFMITLRILMKFSTKWRGKDIFLTNSYSTDEPRIRTYLIRFTCYGKYTSLDQNGHFWIVCRRRTIVSDCSESYWVSQFIDYFVRPVSVCRPSYIKDTYESVAKIRNQYIPKRAFLITGDISSLHTNVNSDRTLEVTCSMLRRHPTPGRPDTYMLCLLRLTMRENDFTFTTNGICGFAVPLWWETMRQNLLICILKNSTKKLCMVTQFSPYFSADFWMIRYSCGSAQNNYETSKVSWTNKFLELK
jgi:hypothetical protein